MVISGYESSSSKKEIKERKIKEKERVIKEGNRKINFRKALFVL